MAVGAEDWRAEFRRHMLNWLVENGEPVRERERERGGGRHLDWLGLQAHMCGKYIDAVLTRHQRDVIADWTRDLPSGEVKCRIDCQRSTWGDAVWIDCSGERCTGIDVMVWCTCGRVQGVRWRYAGGYGDLLAGITAG